MPLVNAGPAGGIMVELTPIDRRLLDFVQREIPLVERPFLEIARWLGITEQEVLARLTELSGKRTAPVRQISAIFDSRALGYQSCLVAARVEPDRLAAAAAVINR